MDFDAKFDHRHAAFALDIGAVQSALPELKIERIEPLSGGYCNANFKLALTDGGPLVLRVGNRGAEVLGAEASILCRLAPVLPVPEVIKYVSEDNPIGQCFALHSLIEGEPLSRVEDTLSAMAIDAIGTQLGYFLAEIHAINYPKSGFFASGLEFSESYDDLRPIWEHEMQRCLSNSAFRERLGGGLAKRLAKYLERHAHWVWSELPQHQLTHADFNQKNIMVQEKAGKWQVTGILDWEFAYSGIGIQDFGNFFRFEQEQPNYRSPLERAYLNNGGELPTRWRARARYFDLMSMLQFLARDEAGARTIRTASAVIEKTLAIDLDA